MPICANGHECPDGAFCVTCGVPLAAAPASPPIAPPPPPEPTPAGPEPTSAPWAPGGTAAPAPTGVPTFEAPNAQQPGVGPASPPPPSAPGDAPAPAVPGAEPKKRSGAVVALGVLGAIAIVGGAAFAGTQLLGGDDAPSDVIVISEPASEGSGDLALVALDTDPKDVEVFAKDATLVSISQQPSDPRERAGAGADVVPVGGKHLVAWSEEEGSSTIALLSPGQKEPEEVLFEEDGAITATLDAEGRHLVVSSFESGCYVSKLGDELERITRAPSCVLTADGTIIAYEMGYDEETGESVPEEVEVFGLDGEELATFEAVAPTWNLEGTHVVTTSGDEVALIDARSGDETATAEGDGLQVLGTTGAGGRILIGTADGDQATLSTLAPGGEQTDLVSAPGVTGQQVRGSDIVVGAFDDGEGRITLARYSAGGDEEQLIEDEEGLGFTVIDQDDPAVMAWSADGDLWGGSATSGDLAELGSIDDRYDPTSAIFDPSSRTGYLFAYDAEADETVVLRIADGEVDPVLDGWSSVSLVHGDASAMVVNAYDEDEDTLVAIEGSETFELDGADGIGQISPRGSELVYTTFDGTEDDREPTVRRVTTSEGADAVDLFPGYSLTGVSWTEPVRTEGYFGDEESGLWVRASASCGDGLEWSDYDSGSVDESGVVACLAVPAGGANVVIDIDADIDTVLEVFDEAGDTVTSSDDDDGFDPGIDTFLDEGVYQVELRPYSEESGSYEAYITIGG